MCRQYRPAEEERQRHTNLIHQNFINYVKDKKVITLNKLISFNHSRSVLTPTFAGEADLGSDLLFINVPDSTPQWACDDFFSPRRFH